MLVSTGRYGTLSFWTSFFLSYFGLFELLSFILNWLFLVSRQHSVGAASLAVIITQFYAGKLECCFVVIWLWALDAGSGIFMALFVSIFTGVIYGNRLDLLVLR